MFLFKKKTRILSGPEALLRMPRHSLIFGTQKIGTRKIF